MFAWAPAEALGELARAGPAATASASAAETMTAMSDLLIRLPSFWVPPRPRGRILSAPADLRG